jgi:hypothetical protein
MTSFVAEYPGVAGLMRKTFAEVAVRILMALVAVALVLVLPRSGSAQIVQLPAGPPVIYQAGLYYPSGPTVFFDGAMMVRVGTFAGFPIYLDPSRDPINVVLVPIGGKLMRPYERSQADIQADLVVPDPPEFPDPPEWLGGNPAYFEPFEAIPDRFAPPRLPPSGASIVPAAPLGGGPASRGVWIEFNGQMWTPTGQGPERSARLRAVGQYFDFPVYQDPARRDRIFVPSSAGGPLIQYDLRPR